MIVPSLILSLAALSTQVSASVTVYAPTGAGAQATAVPCIGAVPCDGNVVDNIPTPAAPGFTTVAPIQLLSGGVPGVSIPLDGSFFGFSVELSVSNQIIGNDGNVIEPNFLNLMATVVNRAGTVYIRVGGNTQETAVLEPQGLPNNAAIDKSNTDDFTPTLLLSPNLLYAMGNASQLLNIKWFLGVPFNDTTDPRTILGEMAEQVLAGSIVGFQLGNEPDLFATNGLRASNYTPAEYTVEWGEVLQDYVNDGNFPNKNLFVGPSICCGRGPGWTPEEVWNTGYLQDYSEYLAYIAVQFYPSNNCNDSGIIDPNTLLSTTFGNHGALINDMGQYANTSNILQAMGKPLVMLETNTASCGGFSGLSDSFGSTLWSIDYALQMAYYNFSNALWHVGGVDDYYNPLTVPAGNQTSYREWTIGSTFYAALFVAETLGTSGKAQIIDLFLNDNNQYSPGYAVYEEGTPTRVALINYLSDPNANYTAYISVGGNGTGQANGTPASVQVKYMLAPAANNKWNITWAGQTFGGPFESDGQLQGDEFIYTIACDQTNNVCPVTVPAPGAAIVFLSSGALAESGPTATLTFATTTTATGIANTATVNQAVLETSNGRGGGVWEAFGSTSYGSSNAAERTFASRWSFFGCAVAALASGLLLRVRW